ncbi:MAG: single-stranded DNA-binding protein [Deltaproteobacteria bacterium]|nr:single-stranded DNA-binding protein [Deltaproteobacteria bacterium]MBW2081626.1 single-stranded DNA-binding protein [Deltaproteobacteria bacterium]
MNLVILKGRLGQDPDLSYTPSGVAVCRFSLATTEYVKGEEKTAWHRVVAFNKIGEAIGNYCKKGREILVEGRLQYGSYEDSNGITRYTTDIIVNRFEFCGDKREAQAAPEDDLTDVPF